MKLFSPLPHRKARIEIIPLIDIMFFLLACMMLVSLNMIQMKGVKMNLPSASSATPENKSDFLTLSVRSDASLALDKIDISRPDLVPELLRRKSTDPDLRVLIQGDAGALHGDVIAILDLVRIAGIQKVTFQTQSSPKDGAVITPAPTLPQGISTPVVP